ncbi:MAG: hypothetical protein IPL79_17510 [Myxococcales bacterium]|nr:hypothetical protein [Myxococcales bacterium]
MADGNRDEPAWQDGGEAAATRAPFTEQVTDPARILAIVDALARHNAQGRLDLGKAAQGEAAPPLEATLMGCDPALTWVPSAAEPGVTHAQPGTSINIELDALNTTFRFAAQVVQTTETAIVTAWPTEITRIRRRWHRRTSTSTPLQIHSSRAGVGTGRMRNISYNGVSFVLDETVTTPAAMADELVPGASIQIVPDGASGDSPTTVTIVARRRMSDGREVYSGEVTATEDDAWHRLVMQTLNPYTQQGRQWAAAQWALYERAGYFSLSNKQPEHFVELRGQFERVCDRLDDMPHLACSIVWPATGKSELIATATMFRVYAHTWMGFQLAKITGSFDGFSGREILRRTLLHCYEHMQRHDDGVRYVAMLVQAKRTWSAYFMYELPLRYVDDGYAAIVRFRALVVEVATPFDAAPSAHAAVGPASPEDAAALAEAIGALRPAMYCEAFDLTPARMGFGDIAAPWHAAGLARQRAVFVARADGELVCGAVLELAQDGVHLFGLLDVMRVYPVRPGGEAYVSALIAAAQAWFAAQGKARFVLMLEDDAWLGEAQRAACVDMGESDAVILSVDRLPEFLEHLYEITAPRTSGEGTFRG